MRKRMCKLERANVLAGFDSQDDADEALLQLRLAGIPDKRIGYYFPVAGERMVDLIARYHRFAASIIWGIVGAVAGTGIALLVAQLEYPGLGPDPTGLIATCATCGALFLGTAGGMMGLWTERPGASAPAPHGACPPYVMAVDAGETRDTVRAILHRHGGYALEPDGSAPPVHHGHPAAAIFG